MAAKKTVKKDASATPPAPATPTAVVAPEAPGPVMPKAKAKAAAPKAEAKAVAPKAKTKAAAPVKLSTSQSDLLKKVQGAGEAGYSPEKKVEEKSLAALQERKLIKKGAKDKATGKIPYSLSATGKKHLASAVGESPSA